MNPRVLAVLPESRLRRSVLRVLSATRSDVVEVPSLQAAAEVLAVQRFALAVIDHEGCADGCAAFLAGAARRIAPHTRILLLAGRLEDGPLAELLAAERLTHLLARTDPLDTSELLVTCEKILRGDIFGLEKYLCWGVEPEAEVVRVSDDRGAVLARLRRYLDGLALPPRIGELACGVADELLTNAIYDAPVDEQGRPRYAHRRRTEPIALGAGEECIFRYACDGRLLALSIRDPFGSLEQSVVLRHLARCLQRGADQISSKAGGAGMGLFYVFSSVNHFVVNLAPGRATETIGLLDVSGSYRTLAARPKSLCFFCGEMGEDG